jgi:subtilisin family serine protease
MGNNKKKIKQRYEKETQRLTQNKEKISEIVTNLLKEGKRKYYDIFSELKEKLKLSHKQGIFPHVINMSLDLSVLTEVDRLEDLGQWLQKNDILFVVSAGNKNQSCQDYDYLEQEYPELLQHMLFVGGISLYSHRSYFSNYPGSEIIAQHFIYAPGEKIFVRVQTLQGEIKGFMNGTSGAAPLVSGSLALLKKYFPELTMLELKKILQETSSPFLKTFIDENHQENFKYGQLNVFKALEMAYELRQNRKTA